MRTIKALLCLLLVSMPFMAWESWAQGSVALKTGQHLLMGDHGLLGTAELQLGLNVKSEVGVVLDYTYAGHVDGYKAGAHIGSFGLAWQNPLNDHIDLIGILGYGMAWDRKAEPDAFERKSVCLIEYEVRYNFGTLFVGAGGKSFIGKDFGQGSALGITIGVSI